MVLNMLKKKKFAIILSGCGGMDGTECHEAISLMIAIKQAGVNYVCFAVNDYQKHVIHAIDKSFKNTIDNEKRNMLIESRRLNHGIVYDIKKLSVNQFDALIFPGGYGTGISLSNFIICSNGVCKKNIHYSVRSEIKEIIRQFNEDGKPIFAGCMAPVLINGSLTGVKIMMDAGEYTKDIIEKHKNTYKICNSGEICIDKKNKIVTAPFYMAIETGVDIIFNESVKSIKEILKMCD